MPITLVVTGPINNHHAPNAAQRDATQDVIATLQYADLWRGPGTLRQNAIMRIDMQGNIPGPPLMKNLQVQVNGLNGASTVAHANVSTTIQSNDPGNQRGALKKVISALNQSLDTNQSYVVGGTNP